MQKRRQDVGYGLAGRRSDRLKIAICVALLLIALMAQAGGPQAGGQDALQVSSAGNGLLKDQSFQANASQIEVKQTDDASSCAGREASDPFIVPARADKDYLAAARSYLNSGLAQESWGDEKKAQETYCQALRLAELYLAQARFSKPESRACGWELRGWALEGLGRPEEALVAYENSLEADPAQIGIRYRIAELLSGSLGRYDQALGVFDQALEMDPDKVAALVEKGDLLLSIGQFGQALQNYDLALEIAPDSYTALTSKGLLLTSQGRHNQALQLFDQALDINPCFARAWFGKGEALRGMGKDNESLQAYDWATLLTDLKGSKEAVIGKGLALDRLGRFKEASLVMREALDYYQRQVDRTPCSVWAQTGLGDAFLGLGQYHKAVAAYSSALHINPHSPRAGQGLKLALSKQRRQSALMVEMPVGG